MKNLKINKKIRALLLALAPALPAAAQIGHEVFNGAHQYNLGTASDFSTYFRVREGGTFTNTGTYYWRNSNTDGTFVINGIYAATGTDARDVFNGGAAAQAIEIAGTAAPVFQHADFLNGATDISNPQGITVNGVLNFSNAITTTLRANPLENSVRLNSTDPANLAANGFSDSRHVDGYFSRKQAAATSYLFPVGDEGSYRPVTYQPLAASDYVSIAYLQGTPPQGTSSFGPGILAVSPAGSWPVSGAVPGEVTVDIPDVSDFALADKLRLVGWDGSAWIELGDEATGNTEGSLLSGSVPSGTTIYALGIGSIVNVLPVRLVQFNARKEAGTALLSWTTANETNSRHFDVERSTDGQIWKTLGAVAAAGESSTAANYTFPDPAPARGINFYRLKMIDLDATFSYSGIVSLEFDAAEEAAEIAAYPNPATQQLKIRNSERVKTLSLVSLSGKPVVETGSLTEAGIDLQHVAPGIYVLALTLHDGSRQTQRIVIGE